MTITTVSRSVLLDMRPGRPGAMLLLLCVLLILAICIDLWAFRWCHNPRKFRYVLAAQVLFLVLFAVSCGGGGSSGSGSGENEPQGTPAGTYTVTVTATSGSVVHSSNVTLTVD